MFGLSNMINKVGVFSFARYDDSFYSSKIKPDRDKIIFRSCKVMCHEILHLFGLKHCIFFNCIMNGSNHDEEAAKKPFKLCPVCLKKL